MVGGLLGLALGPMLAVGLGWAPDATPQSLPAPPAAPAAATPSPTLSASGLGAVETGELGARLVLDNGIVLLVAERRGLPIVHVRASIGAGSILDPPDRQGLASLTADLLTRGTRTRSGPEIDRAIEGVGGTLWSQGGRDASEAGVAVLRRDLGLGLDLLADVLRHPTFPPDEFDRLRAETIAAVRRSEEDPPTVAGRLFRRLLFEPHPYSWPVPGTEASLERITRDEVVAFHARAYRPSVLVVAVAGEISPADAKREIEARLGDWPVGGGAPDRPGPAPLGAPPRTETVQQDLTQATIFLGQASVTRSHPDYYPLEVAAQILGGGSSSRLYEKVREARGLAYSISAGSYPARLAGFFLIDVQTENARVREVLALVREELIRLRRDRVADDELARAKGYLAGSFPLRMATTGQMAALLLAVEEHGLSLDYPSRYRRAIEAVTAESVWRAVRTHWDPDRMSLAVVANLREAGIGP